MAYDYDYGKTRYFKCYYCEFTTDQDLDYQKHVVHNHHSKPVYPTIRYIQELCLKPQNKIWKVWKLNDRKLLKIKHAIKCIKSCGKNVYK